MNATDQNRDVQLDTFIDAARGDVDSGELDAATARFRASLPDARQDRRLGLFSGWWRATAALATLVLAVTVLPLLWPGQPAGQAFAQAQAWFDNYRTLHLQMVTRQGEMELFQLQVWHEAGGATRIELPPVTHIVDPDAREMITFMPGQAPMRQDIGAGMTMGERDDLAWLEELKTFRGVSERLEERRDVGGVSAVGWRLSLSGTTHTLWVAPGDFRPLLLEGELGGGVRMDSRFAFDEPLPDDVFAVPNGD